jgi:alpha-L-rhamnosidase
MEVGGNVKVQIQWRPRGSSALQMVVGWIAVLIAGSGTLSADLRPVALRCEYHQDPRGLDERRPRLSWRVESDRRGEVQTAYRIQVARSLAELEAGTPGLWDSGKVEDGETLGHAYGGLTLESRQECHWRVQVWDREDAASGWSEPARWSMGLLEAEDWTADWISYDDATPLHTNRAELYLPPARYYRKAFEAAPRVRRATVYATALGIYELHVNGRRVGDAYFTPGWSDYRLRAYYNTLDVTGLVRSGANVIGAIVAEGWYSGYVGYGLLVGYGPNRVGRYFYGKTPAVRLQLELEYDDGSRVVVGTDPSWQTSGDGPIREADLIMGETYDARMEQPGWAEPMFAAGGWARAVSASALGECRAVFSDTMGDREVDLGFEAPGRLQAYPGPPIRVTEELAAREMTEPEPGVYIFNLRQNIAGIIRLRVQGSRGMRVQIRYGEMLHPDGRLMTENLRRARATDYYVLRGDPEGEEWSPRFTYHGFQYVELTGLEDRPGLEAVTGLVMHSDTPLTSRFECSDPLVNQIYRNVVWTQRGNFVEIPTDCPQRDERLGWMGDAQIYARAATFNADVASFFTKWMDDVQEAQRSFGAYPDYAPYPMAHGTPRKTFGTAWMDAGIICPWTMWQVYGDRRMIERHYDSMQRFMEFRMATSPEFLGVSIGNPWGDWLALGESTPVEYVDVCYYAYTARLMAEMAGAIGREVDAGNYRELFETIRGAFGKKYVRGDGELSVDTQSAYALALFVGLLPDEVAGQAAGRLAGKVETNGGRMATGFLGTRPLLPVLSAHGHHDLALRLLQSREFPSWGYEVVNGATTIWERWDSYTREEAFGRHNAAMNSFSHYAFGAVCEWLFQGLAGIDTDGPGYRHILIRPGPPVRAASGVNPPLDWVRAEYDSIRGTIVSEWRQAAGFELSVRIPANTTATVLLPTRSEDQVWVDGIELSRATEVRPSGLSDGRVGVEVGSGEYRFTVR